MRLRDSLAAALVIISLALGTGEARAADAGLTTSSAGIPKLVTVVIDGSTVYDATQLFPTYRDQLGRPISRESARAVVAAITALYERDGYVKPEVSLDDALTARGVVRMRIFEAQITRVHFEGDTGRIEEQMWNVAARLQKSKPLRREAVPQALRDLRQLAGFTVTANTERDEKVRNAFALTIRTKYSPVDGVVRMNNRGTDQVGPAFVLGQMYANGVLGRQGRIGLIYASAMDPDEYLGGGLYADTAMADGTRFSTLLFQSASAPNEAPVNLDDTYDRRRATLRKRASPAGRPNASLIDLKRDRSRHRTATCSSRRRVFSACSRRSRSSTRFGRSVTGSCRVKWAIFASLR